MKKRILLVLLAAGLLATGLAGGVYAVSLHQPVKGEKLIGLAPLGTFEIPIGPWTRTTQRSSDFRFTNPDCVGEITITQVSIIRRDETVIYEGPFIRVDGDVREVVETPMTPHETRRIMLIAYMWEGEGVDPEDLTASDNWLSSYDALQQDIAGYTVEIAWEARGPVSPLTGWQQITTRESQDGEKYVMRSESQMVNMKQK